MIADQPELIALASLASVPASRMAEAFNDAEHFFDHISLEELARIKAACERFASVVAEMLQATTVYTDAARKVLEEFAVAD